MVKRQDLTICDCKSFHFDIVKLKFKKNSLNLGLNGKIIWKEYARHRMQYRFLSILAGTKGEESVWQERILFDGVFCCQSRIGNEKHSF
jgi:hypothetical protein